MLNKRLLKFRYIANFSIFAGIVPIGISGVAISSVKNFTDVNGLNKSESVSKNTLRFGDKYISLRSNPMNNFVSLTTTKIGSGNIKEQFTYALCDTATSPDKIKYGKNSGVAKLDYEGKVVALWTLPEVSVGGKNQYIYTTNIVFGDTEEILYVLCGISNPAAALNSVYGNAVVPTKLYADVFRPGSSSNNAAQDNVAGPDAAYFVRSWKKNVGYSVNLRGYSFDNYPTIKIYKLNAETLAKTSGNSEYDFEFPPAEAIKNKGVVANEDEYDKTTVAGFSGGEFLNYWNTNSYCVTDYWSESYYMSLRNTSFFHYLLYGQTFDYVGNGQFLMLPKYVGIDPNLGGLYSLVSSLSGSLASFSNYPSLYEALYRYKGQPLYNNQTKVMDFTKGSPSTTVSYQYQYLDGFGKVVSVAPDNTEFSLKESVVNLILLSIGYFLSSENLYIRSNPNFTYAEVSCSVPGWMLSTYGFICFSPTESDVINKYKLYTIVRDEEWWTPVHMTVFDNMIIFKDAEGVKRYRFLLKSPYVKTDHLNNGNNKNNTTGYYLDRKEYFNADGRITQLFGIASPAKNSTPLGFSWKEFSTSYKPVLTSQKNGMSPIISNYKNVRLMPYSAIDKDMNDVDHAPEFISITESSKVGIEQSYINNLDSIYTPDTYVAKPIIGGNDFSVKPVGWKTEILNSIADEEIKTPDKNLGKYASSSGSKYIVYGDNIIISNPFYWNKLVVASANDFLSSISSDYSKSLKYADDPTLNSFTRISNLFAIPGGKGFGYLTYDNKIKVSALTPDNLKNKQLSEGDLKDLFHADELNGVTFQSVVPVGSSLIFNQSKDGKSFSTGFIDLDSVLSSYSSDNSVMWIIIGVCSAAAMFIALGLGIGIPMRKNAKLQLATTKLSNKKIDMLSTTVAKSFKKLAENTSTLLKNQPKALAAATPAASTRPMGPQQPARPVGPNSPARPMGRPQQPARPVGPNSPARPMGPQQPTRPARPQQPTKPVGPQQPTRPVGPITGPARQ